MNNKIDRDRQTDIIYHGIFLYPKDIYGDYQGKTNIEMNIESSPVTHFHHLIKELYSAYQIIIKFHCF